RRGNAVPVFVNPLYFIIRTTRRFSPAQAQIAHHVFCFIISTSFPPSFPRNRKPKTRHSRAGGNPDLSARKLIG
ncbi:TPA: hypothetical protein ACFISX_001476, partial [Neisseria gonorrhoeae]